MRRRFGSSAGSGVAGAAVTSEMNGSGTTGSGGAVVSVTVGEVMVWVGGSG